MSLQDESFPHDDLDFSSGSGKNFVFPHHKLRGPSALVSKDEEPSECDDIVAENVDNSTCSSIQNHDDSMQSLNDFCPPSETSGKTNASEPNDLQDTRHKQTEFKSQNPNKSLSYQDIHSEYTKRRYKHVESKVGQYIANMKAQDEKRRSSGKFQRHRSMPETLHDAKDSKRRGTLSHSTNDLDHIHDHHHHHNVLQCDHDYDNLTATTSSLSNRDLGSDAGIFLDKLAYEQLLSDRDRKDYLQTKLEEKNAEYYRLKQNLETIRIEYSMCKDKLKRHQQAQRFSGTFGGHNQHSSLGRASLQSLLHPQDYKEKSTQTDIMPSPVPPLNKPGNDMMFATPLTPDSNNNSADHAAVGMFAPAAHKVSKSVATIQPLSLNFSHLLEQDSCDLGSSNSNTTMGFFRRRSNSLATRKKSTPNPPNISRISSAASGVPSSSDSAIEVIESPKSQRRQSRRDKFRCYEQSSQRFSIVETRNAGLSNTDDDIARCSNAMGNSGQDSRIVRKRHNLRSRVMKFFGACTNCEDPNVSMDAVDKSNHSHIPLLQKNSQNNCRNVR